MKSQDLDLLQKQPKEKGIPPCWCQQRVIRRAERFKSSIAITPLPDVCHLHGDTEPQHVPEPEGNMASQHPISSLDKHLPSTKGCWKVEIEALAAGVWKRTQFSQQRSFCSFFPTHTQPSLSHILQSASLQEKSGLMGCSPHSAWLEPLGILKPTSANCCHF